MRRLLMLTAVGTIIAFQARAGTIPLYVNDEEIHAPFERVAPQIDATAFWNQSIFDVSDYGFSGLPYQLLNNYFVTNDAAGYLVGSPGFRFDHFTRNVRRMMGAYVNLGTNIGTKWLLVFASNIVSSGQLGVGPAGLLKLNGRDVSLERNGIRAGGGAGTFLSDGYLVGSNYVNAAGVTDLYWAAGTNNRAAGVGQPVALNTLTFDLPNPQTPSHAVVQLFSGRPFTNTTTLPQYTFFGLTNFFGFGGAAAFAYTNQVDATSKVVQVVFVTTNNADPTFTTDVRFLPNGMDNGSDVFVELSFADYDIIDQVTNRQYVYFTDRSAFVTNISLSRPLMGRTRRPSTYEVNRLTPFEFYLAGPANAVYTNGLIYNPGYLSNRVTMQYAAYAADISSASISNVASANAAVFDPTNFPGRVEILADKVNLDQARIRAESTIILRTKNLTSNHLAQVDAPYLIYDLTSREPELVISNLAPVGVTRLSGQIAAWTGLWKNYENIGGTRIETQFHVLFLDNRLQTFQPVIVTEFRAHATNLVIQDVLPVRKTLLLDAPILNVTGELDLPFGSGWATTNIQKVAHLTNDGIINIPGSAKYGTDRTYGYTNFVNHGTNYAAAQAIRTRYFENSGCLVASRGVFNLDAVTAHFYGAPIDISSEIVDSFCLVTNVVNGTNVLAFTNCLVEVLITNSSGAKLSSSSAVDIRANTLTLSNALLIAGATAPGTLRLTVTNSLTDGGQDGISLWITTGGFQMGRRPVVSDLRGTYVTSRAGSRLTVFHTWAGLDFGATPIGFENNLALGKLTIDSGSNSVFRFRSATTGSTALYVDYLEVLNDATNYNKLFAIERNFTIYFANANVPAEKLDGAANGRIRWVRDYAGPLSGVDFAYPSGNIYRFNIALVTSKDIDSDGDGFSNADDPEPFGPEPLSVAPIIPASIAPASLGGGDRVVLQVGTVLDRESARRRAVLTWNAPARVTSCLEYKDGFEATSWRPLTNLVGGALSRPMSVLDDVPAAGLRIYRVRIEPTR